MLLTGLTIAGLIYVLVSIVSVALVPVGQLADSDTPLVEVVKAGAPGLPIEDILPFITMFAVSNTALINMLMASRLIYGMARQRVLPPVLGKVHPHTHSPWVAILFTTAIAFGLIIYVTAFADSNAIAILGGTTSLLLLAVFAVVNVAVLALRRDVRRAAVTSKRQRPCPSSASCCRLISSLRYRGVLAAIRGRRSAGTAGRAAVGADMVYQPPVGHSRWRDHRSDDLGAPPD